MSSTASLGRLPSQTGFGRFFTQLASALDRVALIAARNGDLPYSGL